MKIFRIERHAGEWPRAAKEALETPEAVPEGVLRVRLLADSALVRNNRPVFVPDFAREGWVVEVLPAIIIQRLGKFISPRFAHRHIGGFSLAACLHPAGMSVPDALTDSFDGAIVLGEPSAFPTGETLRVTALYEPLSSNGGRQQPESRRELHVEIHLDALHIADTVALLSRYATLKSGDIILPASVGLSFPVILDHSLTASADGASLLSLRIK